MVWTSTEKREHIMDKELIYVIILVLLKISIPILVELGFVVCLQYSSRRPTALMWIFYLCCIFYFTVTFNLWVTAEKLREEDRERERERDG